MNDLISRQAVLKQLKGCLTGGETEYEYVKIHIDSIPPVTLQEPKWIPVSERLPEEGVDVLACFYTGEGNYMMMVSRRSDYNYWSGIGRTADMVAWMPLPSPYKESEG